MADKRWRILIVDDEPNNLQLMMQILSGSYQLAFAANGSKALEIAQKLETDLILLDIMMPDMDGYEVCKRLKADEKTKNIPVIFVTAKDEVDDETRGLELGAIDYITKPVSPSIVKARVKNHLELKLATEKIEKQNKRLEEQNKELVEAARLREDVDNIVRHDLKNPLNAIVVFPNFIREEDLSEKQTTYLNMIEESGLVMLNMINLSLDLFKMERDIYRFQPAEINILQIIKRVINEAYSIAHKKRISLNIFVNGVPGNNEDWVSAQGEELLCYSMLMNLVKNAVEASPKKEQIAISIDNETSDEIMISIRNKGAVPGEIRDNFFGKYVSSGKKTGTGLGTYSAKMVAETQGGSICLDTSDETETNVIVSLKRWDPLHIFEGVPK
ncbi:MAG: response regulator [Desulfobacterales bacterium]|nr:response regulator [Desulfobacterales bacterium]